MFSLMGLRAKMLGGVVLVALMSGIIGTISLINMHKMSDADQKLYTGSTTALPELSKIGVDFQGMRIASRDFINAQSNDAQRSTFAQQIQQRGEEVKSLAESYQQRDLSPEMQKLFAEFTETHRNYQSYLSQIVALATEGKDKQAWAILGSDSYNQTSRTFADRSYGTVKSGGSKTDQRSK